MKVFISFLGAVFSSLSEAYLFWLFCPRYTITLHMNQKMSSTARVCGQWSEDRFKFYIIGVMTSLQSEGRPHFLEPLQRAV